MNDEEWKDAVEENQRKWDWRFLLLAEHISQWSKDPSTKTGAVIVDPLRRVVSLGYNGLPRGVRDDDRLNNRDWKYSNILHCERNAILFSPRSLVGCTLYTWPFLSCTICAGMVIQVGITRHVAPYSDHPRFGEAQQASSDLFKEAGVELELLGMAPRDIDYDDATK